MIIKNFLNQEIEIETEKVFEVCSSCDTEQEIETTFSENQYCKKCRKKILPCSLCNMDIADCEKCLEARKNYYRGDEI